MKMKLTAFLLMLLFSVLCSNGQNNFRAIHWDIEDGLSGGVVYSMLQDVKGFLWIATESGLDRFDGNTFKNYFADKNNNRTITDNLVLKLIEDSLHNIWIGTPKGMSRYDIKADTFSHFFSNPEFKGDVFPFTATSSHIYCIEGFSFITNYDIHTLRKKILMKLTPADAVTNGMASLYSIFDPGSNSVWMLEGSYGRSGGLYQIFLSNGKRKHYTWPCYRNIPGHSHWSEAMKYDQKRNSIWINSPDGLMEFTLRDKQFHHIDAMNELIKLNNYNRFVGIDLDKQGRVWLATQPKGMIMYDPYKQSITLPFSKDSVLGKDVAAANMSIYCDRNNMVWSGFWVSKGLYQLIPYSPTVKQYTADDNHRGLSDNSILNCVNGNNGTVWMGTFYGLNIFDPQKDSFQILHENDLPGFKGKQIIPAGIDATAQKAWLHSEAGLFEMDIRTHRCKKIIFKDVNFNVIQHPDIVKPLWSGGDCQFKNGCIIPAYADQKLSLFVINSDSAIAHQILMQEPFNSRGMSVGYDKYIFLQTPDETAITYMKQNGNWVRIRTAMDSIKRRRIIYSRGDSSFWVRSDRELFHFDKRFQLIRSYTQKDGLPSNDLYSHIADHNGNVWFTTDRSISELNISNGKITSLSAIDGFKKQNFLPGACVMEDVSGDLYFLGAVGSQVFAKVSPNKLNLTYPPSTVYINSIEVNQEIFPFQTSINKQGGLSLKYFQNNISIGTGTIDFYSKGTNTIRYKLEGLYNNWQYAPANYVIRYNALSHRKYKLIIQASNAAGEFNGPMKIMFINVKPPFWNTWLFYLLISTVIAIAIYKMFQLRLHQKLKVFKVRQKLHRDLHDDVGATLSSIKVYSEILEDKSGDNVITNLIKNNAVDMIDKLEIIAWATNPLHDSFKSFKEMLAKNTASICHAKNIRLNIQVEGVGDYLIMPGDIRQNLTLICKECINNIIKHSGGSNCDINIFIKNRRFLIVIADNGKGFYETTKSTGNGIKNMQKRIEELQGKINIQSKPEEGTIITIDLAAPFKNARFMG